MLLWSFQVTYKLGNSRSIGKFSIKRMKRERNNGEKSIQEIEEKKTQILKYKQQICSVTILLQFGYIVSVWVRACVRQDTATFADTILHSEL